MSQYLKINLSATQGQFIFSVNTDGNAQAGTYASSVEYSFDNNTWSTLQLNSGNNTIQLGWGGGSSELYLRNDSGVWSKPGSYGYWYITISCTVDYEIIEGSLSALLDYNDDSVVPPSGAFARLFKNDTHLTMFTPEFVTETLSNNLCEEMFYGCTNLTDAMLEFPGYPTTIPYSCFLDAFHGCTSLFGIGIAVVESADTFGDRSCEGMFTGCTSLNALQGFPTGASTLGSSCFEEMYYGCTNVNASGNNLTLPATTLANSCYKGMFRNCTSLDKRVILPATSVLAYSYQQMFSGCTSLSEVVTYADTINTTYPGTANWLQGVAATGTLYNNGSATYTPNSASGIPTGWTEVLPTKTITATAGSNGSISPSGAVTVNVGASQTFTVTPDAGYIVDTLTVDGATATLTNDTYTFSNVQADHTISVTFKLPDLTDYFYIENTYNGQNTVTLTTTGSGASQASSVEYSKDKNSWTTLTLTAGGTNTITLNSGEKVYFRNDSGMWNSGYYNYTKFTANQNHTVGGNVNTLIDYTDLNSVTLSNYCFHYLFYNDTNLTSAANLSLPSTTLAMGCYANMFMGCTHLTAAPTLPATTLAVYCYNSMFQGCTSLTTAPALPATTLVESCYNSMFKGCTSLTSAPTLSATTLAMSCYANMFMGCTHLTAAPTLPATALVYQCYTNMFNGCTSLTAAPTLPATTLAGNCYYGMFMGCTHLTTAPTLPVTTLATGCYNSMFQGCTSLTTAPALPATTLVESCYNSMFQGCTSLTSAPTLSATTLAMSCYANMFMGCTHLTAAPTLPATTLAAGCYYRMFWNCNRLNSVTTYANNIAYESINDWLQGVAATGTLYNNGSVTYTPNSASGIPTGWTEVRPSKTITATAGSNGSISPSGAVSVNIGSDQTFTFTPDTGYEVDTVTVDGSTVTPTNNTYTFTNVQADHTISVTFKLRTFTINAISEGHTTVNPSGLVTVNYGASQTFTFSPIVGYELDKLYIDGVETAFSGSSYTFTNVQSDHTLEITSKLRSFTIEATSSEGGSITPDGIITVEYGSDKTFILEANAGHLLWELTVDGVDRKSEVVDDSFTFENVTADHTIHPVWDDIYLIVTATSGPNGSITPNGDTEIIYNGNLIFNLTPNEGYEIDTLLLDGTDVTDEIEDFNFILRNIVENHTLEVTFKEMVIPTTNGFNFDSFKNRDYVKQYKIK